MIPIKGGLVQKLVSTLDFVDFKDSNPLYNCFKQDDSIQSEQVDRLIEIFPPPRPRAACCTRLSLYLHPNCGGRQIGVNVRHERLTYRPWGKAVYSLGVSQHLARDTSHLHASPIVPNVSVTV